MLCPLIKVLVSRAAIEQIPTTCYGHELGILSQIHGMDNVTLLTDEPLMFRPMRYQEEYARLTNKYGLVPEEKYTWVEHTFGPLGTGKLKEVMEQGMDYVRLLTEVDVHDIEDEEAPIMIGPEPGSYPWTKQQLSMFGINYQGNAKKVDLEALLRNEYCERLEADWEKVAGVPLPELADQLMAATPTE